ncbi:type I-G CRISPR-associated protein Csb2 [Haliangium sp.]|uniref:type I-G CRISPR-associated protein Csb2 n=1 Tax=Haliangium sp. TaxID=2663208 RepID=UPI003D0D8629
MAASRIDLASGPVPDPPQTAHADPGSASAGARDPGPETAAVNLPRPALGATWLCFRLHLADEPGRASAAPARLGLTATRAVTAALRGALLRRAPQPPRELVSGHLSDGCPSQRPHLAYLALPSLRWSERPRGRRRLVAGAVTGVALVAPHGLDPADFGHLDLAVAPPDERPIRLRLGRLGAWHLEPVLDPDRVGDPGLDARTWLGPARRWRSVTPVALDRFPRRLFSADAGVRARARDHAVATVAQSCVRVGLPAPRRVHIDTAASVPGAPASPRYPRFDSGGVPRLLVHVDLDFAAPVCGPVVLGAGRYAGLGLCLPVPAPDSRRSP